jgi:hypothetical protein
MTDDVVLDVRSVDFVRGGKLLLDAVDPDGAPS